MKYLPNLKKFNLNLARNDLGKNGECMNRLSYGIKILPKSLENFVLNLGDNNLGKNIESIIYLA